MKLAIMQPYLFPYIGYFQLINVVDTFVFFDDVNYINRGWINRNNILLNKTKKLVTLSLEAASISKHINQIFVADKRHKIVQTIYHAYVKAPYFKEVFPIIEDCLFNEEQNLAALVIYSIKSVANYLNLSTSFCLSSEIKKDNTLKNQHKIVSICKILDGIQYINPIGGKELYSKEYFKANNIELNFLRCRKIEYKQFNNDFVPNLSIIDMLMFCSIEEIKSFLEEYDLE